MPVHGSSVCLYPILQTGPASHQLAHSGPVTRTLPRLIRRGRAETSPPSVFAVRSFSAMVLVSSGTAELTLCFICPCISLFKLYFYTNLIGCMCFYEADTIVRVVREYPNSKLRVPEFSGIAKPKILKTRITDPKFLGNPNAHPY
jgi:hypothetical protein